MIFMKAFLISWCFFIALLVYLKIGEFVVFTICIVTDKIDDCFHSAAAAFGETIRNDSALFLFWPFILFLLVYDITYTIVLIPFRICYIVLYWDSIENLTLKTFLFGE